MTSRERVLRAMRREGKPDRPPFEISWGAFTPSLMKVFREKTGSDLEPDEYFDFDTRSVNVLPTRKQIDFKKIYNEELPASVFFDEWGVGMVPGSMEHFVDYKFHPLAACESVEEIGNYDWPDLESDYRYEGLADKVEAYHKRGYAVMGELYQTIFEMAWLLRGMENLLVDFCINEEIAEAICEKLMTIRINQAKRYARAGVDIIRLGDDVSTQRGPMMSPQIYARFLKPKYKKIIEAAREINPDILFFLHCDGKVEDFVSDFVDVGIDILNPIQPECNDLDKLFSIYGDRISFWGGIGTQSTMPFGTPDEVKEKVIEVQNQLGQNGGLLLAPTHILEPEVPWDNIISFIEAARNAYY